MAQTLGQEVEIWNGPRLAKIGKNMYDEEGFFCCWKWAKRAKRVTDWWQKMAANGKKKKKNQMGLKPDQKLKKKKKIFMA